ncbi:MAG: acetylornithine/succinyldiaminopimelate transaminase [Panacagrimonas sp.]
MNVSRQTFDEVMVPNYQPASMIPVRGQGSRIWDRDGREYLDFACGIAVTGLGHAHPALLKALNEQAARLWHISNIMTNEPALKLARKLTQVSFAERVFFANSGGEANEAAFKLARKHAFAAGHCEKNEIIAFDNGFHGRTLFTVSVGGQPKYTEGFGPLPAAIRHLPFNDIGALQAAISDKTCAVVLEPVQGEGGVMPAQADFLQSARALCDQYGALLILDEIQTGNGRTGRYFAYQQFGVTPDILTTAKGLGGGFPVSAMLTRADIANSLAVGTHGTTYGGNPLACAVALAAVEECARPELLANVQQRSQQLREGLTRIGQAFGMFDQVRGMGLLLGAPLNAQWQGRARDFLNAGLEAGIWTLVAGPDVLRFAPPLNISQADVDEGLGRFETACAALSRR